MTLSALMLTLGVVTSPPLTTQLENPTENNGIVAKNSNPPP